MSDQDPTARLNFLPAAGITVFSLVISIGWVVLAMQVFHLHANFAAFVFAFYWAFVEKGDFKLFPKYMLGALLGIAISWALVTLPAHMGALGFAIAMLFIIAGMLLTFANWIPILLNPLTLLFLAIFTAAPVVANVNFLDVAASTLLGGLYFAAILYLAGRVQAMQTKSVKGDVVTH